MQTFVILKPEAIELGLVGAIVSRFERAGFKIKNMKLCRKYIQWHKKHYRSLPQNIFDRLYLCMQGQLLGIVLEGHDAIARVRMMVGNTLPNHAQPGTIRFDFGKYPAPRNMIHAADCQEAVKREIQLFFDEATDV